LPRLALRSGGFEPVVTCHDPHDALRLIRRERFSLILLDLAMPGMSGEELLALVRQERPSMPVIIVTAFNDAETAMRCVHAGAYDYLTKPLDKARLLTTVKRTLDAWALRDENLRLKQSLLGVGSTDLSAFNAQLTGDECMLSVFRYAQAIAASAEPVLITGETGTGKDLMARALHSISGRRGEFVVINVAGLDEHMFSDVLFGHSKGAYTGATALRGGLLQKAAEGTIFLDEVGDVALSLQTRLLRVLESGDYYAGGSDSLCRSSARVIVATNRDVEALCAGGRMRPDLYYRLDVHHIHLPPLRERGDDVMLLAQAFARSAAEAAGVPIPVLERDVADLLMQYEWPGNVRELRAVITDAVRAQRGVIGTDWLRTKLRMENGRRLHSVNQGRNDLPTLRESTDALVRQAMQQAGGNQCQAARLLGISQPALSKRLKHITWSSPSLLVRLPFSV